MNQRDKAIVEGLKKFRILDRDQLIKMYFSDVKQKTVTCNRVMKRLNTYGLVSVNRNVRPYAYFPSESTMKPDSTKIPHFKAIADFYIQICEYKAPTVFEVEPKVGDKGTIEPDIFMVWNGAPFFVEIQRDFYTKKRMNAKYKRYLEYYKGGQWKEYTKYFPFIWIVTEIKYRELNWEPLKVYQSKNVSEFVRNHMTKKKEP
ncbi:replication-relaxation family protein [Weizmannia sp. CD-2023]|uniref:replication-relaxation family protein n=1 Tax=Heyndrickxia TaxID=2837504 RepID=UPI002E1C013B|nr:replication-relaxation family protein [Weizmannia sp. CD-2023]MED4899737.1 replication-relaxation family protein [Weizmannia sp. CD-2023]